MEQVLFQALLLAVVVFAALFCLSFVILALFYPLVRLIKIYLIRLRSFALG